MTETQIGLMRFENWQRWACGGEISMIMQHYYPPKAAVCGMHVSSEVWDEDYGAMPIDERDAEKIERLIKKLPVHLYKAVRYHYTGRPRVIGIPSRVITEWVEQAAREVMSSRFHL